MDTNFARAMKIELTYEGGKDDDPKDPGGRTNQGITQRVYTAWRLQNKLGARDVFLMENNERDAIYKNNYFDKVRFGELPPGVDVVVVDGAINSGVSQSIKWVQRALNISADGVLGDITMQRIQDHPDHDQLIKGILDRRRAFLKALSTFSHFGKGWLSRVDSLQKTGQAWAMGSVGPNIYYVPNANKKAMLADAKPMPLKAIGDATAAGGTVTTALSGAQNALSPLQGTPFVDKVLMGILVAGIVLTAGGFAWSWYARRRTEEMNDALDTTTAINVETYATADNDNTPNEVLQNYADPEARGGGTGNIAEGHVTTSGRVAGDTEVRTKSEPSAEKTV